LALLRDITLAIEPSLDRPTRQMGGHLRMMRGVTAIAQRDQI
jgi:hypothetical protein